MKKILITSLLFSLFQFGYNQTVTISASEPDAKIYVDGQNQGTGLVQVKVPKNTCVNVKVIKPGFLKYEQTYCNKKGEVPPPKKQYFDMKLDDAEEASVKSNQVNVDIAVEVNPMLDQTQAWQLATRIVTDYFDAIEVADKETSYLRTAWSIQSFQQNTIRTRFIIKYGYLTPLTYKIKLVSEASGANGTSVKSDELFREWDRVLRRYRNVISDFETRLGNK